MNTETPVGKQTYAGLFMVTLATLMYEILLTRIFSVTMWYHYAFVAISIALFGMTVGALLVYLFPNYFTQARIRYQLVLSSLLFSISIVFSFLVYLSIPFVIHRTAIGTTVGLFPMSLICVVISIPFVFSGICVCLALTKFPRHVSKLYAADLAGAAVGCILLRYTLNITDGTTAVFFVALLASIGAVLFIGRASFNKLKLIALIYSILLTFFVSSHTVLVRRQLPLLRLKWVKGGPESRPLYEKWNSFSRIAVWGDKHKLNKPFGWGLSPVYPSEEKFKQLHMNIDAAASTHITAFNGNLNDLEYLKYDIINLAHYARPGAKVLVIGAGGGRDILSALAFKQKSVVGVEINGDILDAVNKRFGDFSGHLDKNPKVTFIVDEARSYIARHKEKFDIIQVSLIDTWAATVSGAFVFTENALYTVEAWKIFLEHLAPNGVLTFSRWYFRDRPGEIYRLTCLASTSLMRLGVKHPRNHIVVVRNMRRGKTRAKPDGIGTILVCKDPFSDKALDTIEAITSRMQFDLVQSPRFSLDSTFSAITSGKDLDIFTEKYPINITAPTDDRPFFFHMLRLRDIFNRKLWRQGTMSFNMKAIFILSVLLIIVLGLTFLGIIVPLILTNKRGTLKGALPLLIFFACIGFGFMFVEISQMQRLIIFLGHPTYGLSVVLFALLLSSGLGSYLTQKTNDLGGNYSSIKYLFLLLCALTVFGMLTPYIIGVFQKSTTVVRILAAVGILFPLGLLMGMPFPLGMKIASTKSTALTPWLWGINGATSVCASVLAIAIALSASISTSFWIGFLCYAVALMAFVWAGWRKQ